MRNLPYMLLMWGRSQPPLGCKVQVNLIASSKYGIHCIGIRLSEAGDAKATSERNRPHWNESEMIKLYITMLRILC
jgi:hypothetical protein